MPGLPRGGVPVACEVARRWGTAVVVDDGIATAATARVACRVARAHGRGGWSSLPRVLTAHRPLRWEPDIDELVVLETPGNLTAVGRFYADSARWSTGRC